MYFLKPSRGNIAGGILVLILALAIILIPVSSVIGSGESTADFEAAPPNPDFEKYIRERPRLLGGFESAESPVPGYVPPLFDSSHIDNVVQDNFQTLAALPATWDWRTQGKVTPVKNQGNAGTCWAFATLGSLESRIKIVDGETYDFSEQNLVTGVDPAYVYLHSNRQENGGNFLISTDMLSKKGTRLESSQPYNTATLNTDVYFDDTPVLQRINNFRLIANSGTDPANYVKIKTAISTYGPVMAAYYVDDTHFDLSTNTFYYPNCSQNANHAVCIVGWDDNKAHPAGGGHGAWIVKNSWGTSFGESGYFYLCYGSAALTSICGYYGLNKTGYEDYIPGEQIYYWDEAGLRNAIGNGTSSSWMRSIFTANKAGSLTNIEFWTTSSSAQYQIQIRNSSDGLLYSQSGTCLEAGYYSILLNSPVSLSASQMFKVDVNMTTPGFNYPIPVESISVDYCEPEIQANVSFVKTSGGSSWIDTAGIIGGCNVCLRAVVQDPVVLALTTDPQTLTAGQVSEQITVEVQNNVTHDPVPVSRNTIINLSSSSNTGKFDTSSSGLFNGAITSVTIPTGNSNASFYYKDPTCGTPTITVASTGLGSIIQQETINPGPATKIRVETAANGTGTTVGARNLVAGNTLTVYGVTRDQYNNYLGNPAETAWSLIKTGGVADTDLSAASGASVTLTANLVGSAVIQPVNGDLTPTDSGTITISKGALDHLQIQIQPASTLSVDSAFNTAAVVKACDAGGNPINGVSIVAIRDPATGSGVLRGTLSVAANINGLATFTNLAYNKTDIFRVKFTSGTKTVISDPVGPLSVGAVKAISIASNPAAGASVDVPLAAQPIILVKDQFDNPVGGVNVIATIATGTGTALRGTTTVTSVAGMGLATFTNLGYNKSGQAFTLRFNSGTLSVNSGPLGPLAAGAAAQIRVETAANGAGTLVVAQTLLAGNTLKAYGVTRDQYDNYAGNPADTGWSLADIAGNVANTDLSAATGASVTLTAHLAGSALIHAENGTLTSVDSGTIIVNLGPPAAVNIATPSAVGASVDVPLGTQPVILVTDSGGNPVGGTTVTASKATGTGTLRGNLAAVSDIDGLAAFTDLGYSKAGEAFAIRFAAGNLSVNSDPLGPMAAGAAAQIRVESAADGSGKAIANGTLKIGASLTVYGVSRDQYNNYVDNPAGTAWSLINKTGGVVDGDLVPSVDNKSAVMTGHQKGTAIIQGTNGSLTGISGIIKVGTTSSGGGGGGGGTTLNKVTLSGLSSPGLIYVSSSGIVSAVSHVTAADGTFTLNIPAGTQMTTKENSALISLTSEILAAPPASPANSALVVAYNFGPEGASFNPALTMVMRYDPARLPVNVAEKDLYIAGYDGSQWQSLESTVDTQARTVSARIIHFSRYALLGKVTPPPAPAPSPTVPPAPSPSPAPAITPTPEAKPQPTSTPAVAPAPTLPAAPIPAPAQPVTPSLTPAITQPTSTPSAISWPMVIGIIIAIIAILAVSILVIRKRKARPGKTIK